MREGREKKGIIREEKEPGKKFEKNANKIREERNKNINGTGNKNRNGRKDEKGKRKRNINLSLTPARIFVASDCT